ncbi:hypothetical protein Syun_027429 [Stephania yunnanensis]|uniref:Peptidase S8/S53 domain-containing protein n=1 Tax=Stephania yunnanensis TaxID=152371 RepID=A0AAP0HL17_9MAGN
MAEGQCFEADILAAIDEAIHDGVYVISMSLGGTVKDYFQNGISIRSFHAARKGIVVVCSAGNARPTPQTTENLSPFIFTVATSTMIAHSSILSR